MSDMPERIRLSRAKGWKMPANTVKVDRSTPWGNPFIVGEHGTAARCVELYAHLLHGLICLGTKNAPEQRQAHEHVRNHIHELAGKNLACWCPLDRACHADILLRLANE